MPNIILQGFGSSPRIVTQGYDENAVVVAGAAPRARLVLMGLGRRGSPVTFNYGPGKSSMSPVSSSPLIDGITTVSVTDPISSAAVEDITSTGGTG